MLCDKKICVNNVKNTINEKKSDGLKGKNMYVEQLKMTEKIYRHVTENANHFLLFYMFIFLFAVFLQVDHRYHISDHRYAKGRLKKRLKAKKNKWKI